MDPLRHKAKQYYA